MASNSRTTALGRGNFLKVDLVNRFESALAGEAMPGARVALLGGFDDRALLGHAR
jgi:hypothetical protein